MYLLYLDDSGSAGNPDEHNLVLGGLIVFERQAHWIRQSLNEIATELSPSLGGCPPSEIEFHASEVVSGRDLPWSCLRNKLERIRVMERVLGVLPKAEESTCAMACAVHKSSFPDKDPMEIAFEELCQRFDIFLKRLYHETNEPHRGLIVLDKTVQETSLQRLLMRFWEAGTRWGGIHNMSEVPLFVDSKNCRLVQLADHIAYATFRNYEAKDHRLFDIVARRFVRDGERIHGLVHRTREPDCMCLACVTRRACTE
ncbi:MAG: DUF3800 domain-containing protein [Thermoanaerobaculaceae bacterium]|jgi:hypothetical protein